MTNDDIFESSFFWFTGYCVVKKRILCDVYWVVRKLKRDNARQRERKSIFYRPHTRINFPSHSIFKSQGKLNVTALKKTEFFKIPKRTSS